MHYLPPGSVALYYLRPGQTEYSETQKVFARVSGENQYAFDLGGLTVTGLRIDPDSVGGVPTLFTGIDLEPRAHGHPLCPDGRLVAGAGVCAGSGGGDDERGLFLLYKEGFVGEGFILPGCVRWRRPPRRGQDPSYGLMFTGAL